MGTKSSGIPGLFGFDSALLILKAGGRVRRMAWGSNGNWMHIKRTQPNDHQTLMTIQRVTSDGFDVPYTPNATDLLSNDWTAEHIGDMIMSMKE